MARILDALTEVKHLRTQVTELQQQQQTQVALATTVQPMLEEPEKPIQGDTQSEEGIDTTLELPPVETLEKPNHYCTSEQRYGEQIEALYKDNPQITVSEVEEAVGCSRNTAAKWLKRLKPQA